MTITQNVDPDTFRRLTNENIEEINTYISASMTATCLSDGAERKFSRQTITSALIYYWMILFGIPFECQKWHLNRLLTLIKVCSVKNQPPKRRSSKEIMSQNAALNAARRKRFNTKG